MANSYACPMHPQVIMNAPGNCPICDMKLIPIGRSSDTSGHHHSGHRSGLADFKRRFYWSLLLTIPIMLLSEMIQHWLNIHLSFPGSSYVLLILSSIVFFYGGWPFLKGLAGELKSGNPGMMTLIRFGKSTYRKMVQNLIWATGYNVVALPLAAVVLYNYGILLSPVAGAVLMSLSTIVVAINAGLLKLK